MANQIALIPAHVTALVPNTDDTKFKAFIATLQREGKYKDGDVITIQESTDGKVKSVWAFAEEKAFNRRTGELDTRNICGVKVTLKRGEETYEDFVSFTYFKKITRVIGENTYETDGYDTDTAIIADVKVGEKFVFKTKLFKNQYGREYFMGSFTKQTN